MSYDELSDFEINKLVALSLGIDEKIICNDRTQSAIRIGLDYTGEWVDYCNNPNDAWPIITSSKIDLEWTKEDCCAAKYYTTLALEELHNKKDIHYHNKNFLRAAMIVFLMMKDGDK